MKSRYGKWLLVAALVFAFVLFWALDGADYLTLSSLKAHRESLRAYYSGHRLLFAAAYFGIYVLVTALSLPGAAVLTLAGGALFGLVLGTLLVSFASSAGATLSFLGSRYLFKSALERRFGDTLAKINNGIAEEGAFYLFTLRLIPVFPFFLINLLMGMTNIPTRTFYLVSQLGMLPGTIVYVNAGSQLADIEDLSGIFSLGLLLSFAAIGLLPLISRQVVRIYKHRTRLRHVQRPSSFDYNLVVIGGGSGGLVTAYIAASVRAKVALIEREKMGGDCLNTGCVPSKALLRSAKIISYGKRAAEFGLKSIRVEYELSAIMERVQEVIAKIAPHDSPERYTALGVECITGEAEILDPYRVKVGNRILTTRAIVVASGARPLVPKIPGLDQIPYYTTETVWGLRELPQRLLVLGGGPVGIELAQAFSRFGSKVTVVEMLPRILPAEEPEVSEYIEKVFREEGIEVRTGHKAKRFIAADGKRSVVCEVAGSGGSGEAELEFDELFLVLGRKPNTAGLGLENLGIGLNEKGFIAHDEFLRTSVPNIYVSGDCAGPYQFTHMASHQAWHASLNALFSPLKSFKVDYRLVPWCTFCDPEVARAGLSEKEAKDRKIAYEVTRYELSDLDRAIAESEAKGFIKVITPRNSDKILGVTIVGAVAGELLAEFVFAMRRSLGLNKILGTIHVYPTYAEANKYAAGAWRRAHTPAFAMSVLSRFHRFRRS